MSTRAGKKITDNMVALFFSRVEENPDSVIIHYKPADKYLSMTRGELAEKVRNLGKYLIKSGIKKGDKIALFSFNRYEWWVADLAIFSIGAINVPIYPTNSDEEALYVIKHSGSKICLSGDKDQIAKSIAVKKKCASLKSIISFDNIAGRSVVSMDKALAAGAKLKDDEFNKRKNAVKGSDIASIIYTSGTTGHPKGVMLTHFNFYSNALQVSKVFADVIDHNDIFMSFLPLSHALERTAAYYTPILYGCSVAFAGSIKTVVEDMKLIHPTILNSVPRLYEKIHAGVKSQLQGYGIVKKTIANLALKSGRSCINEFCHGKSPSGIKKFFYRISDKLVLSKIRQGIGIDKITVAISGGASLAGADMEFFMGLGVKLYEGYGLTETSPIISVNRPGLIKPNTVGAPLVDTIVKLTDEGEILVKGPQVMSGYYKNPEATKEIFTKDNYIRTGDLGSIDEDGYIRITGRIKDIIVTAGGKNISPQNIENNLKKCRYIEQIAVIGDKRKYLTALIVVNAEEVKRFSKVNNIIADENFLSNELIVNEFKKEIEKYTKNLSRVEQIKKFKLLNDEWSQATGELTGTLKIKRRVVEEKYKHFIEDMYRES